MKDYIADLYEWLESEGCDCDGYVEDVRDHDCIPGKVEAVLTDLTEALARAEAAEGACLVGADKLGRTQSERDALKAENERLREALTEISRQSQCNVTASICRGIARRALDPEPAP